MVLRPQFPAGLLQSKRLYIVGTRDHSQLIPDMKSIVIRRLALASSQTSTKVHGKDGQLLSKSSQTRLPGTYLCAK